jgi:hypothetical protein
MPIAVATKTQKAYEIDFSVKTPSDFKQTCEKESTHIADLTGLNKHQAELLCHHFR